MFEFPMLSKFELQSPIKHICDLLTLNITFSVLNKT